MELSNLLIQKLIEFFDSCHDYNIQFKIIDNKTLKIQCHNSKNVSKTLQIKFDDIISNSFLIYYLNIRGKIKGFVDLSDDLKKLTELTIEVHDFYCNRYSLLIYGNEVFKDNHINKYHIALKLMDINSINVESD